jgi:hypothetical protein
MLGRDAAATASAIPTGPPRPPFVLSVGVTGHRIDALDPKGLAALRGRIRSALQLIAAAGNDTFERERACFAPDRPRLNFLSPLADGADQIAAEVALELGWELHAVLPFARDKYRELLSGEEAATRFDALMARSGCTLELPGDPADELDAYVMTGRATVAHCDLLMAVWDGLPPRGRGGTGEVVELAVVNGTPVIHVPVDDGRQPQLLWSAFDPAVVTRTVDKMTERPFDRPHLDTMLTALFAPPADPQEQKFLSIYARERIHRIRARIEYPLMLAAAGVARFNPRNITEAHCARQIRDEWVEFRRSCAQAHQVEAPFDLLEHAYSWSDQLATRFAQTYRSGHVFNFLFGGLAVCMGLLANVIDDSLLEFAIAEGFVTIAILLNTHLGVKNEWHRRWLDYRQLAERLRPMRSMKLLGLAAPDPPGSLANPVPRRWIDWYATGIWRAMGCPAGAVTPERAAQLGQAVAAYEIAPQVRYHERHSRQIELLDHRLEKIAGGMFLATLAVTIVVIIGLYAAPDFVNRYDSYFTLVEAGFPALGTAVFGIRFQGDFGGSAVRSQATALALRQIELELAGGVSLSRAADLTEQAARTMQSHLDEWRLVNQQQDLDLL